MSNKKEYGQFFTTNFDKILRNIDCKGFKDEDIIEPFVGGTPVVRCAMVHPCPSGRLIPVAQTPDS